MASGDATESGGAPEAWGAYRGAIEELYRRDAGELIEAQSVEMREPPGYEAIDAALELSDRLEAAITESFATGNPEQRELAMLQFTAAATVDLSVAHDLARQAAATE